MNTQAREKIMNPVFDKTLKALQTAGQMRQLKQNVLSANVANVETPGYKAKKVDFEEALKSALNSENSMALDAGIRADVYDNPEIDVANDGNTVDMEKEMAAMTENNIMYRAVTQMINKKLAALKYAATDGGR
jgi:flagellar basal-body rod protein FlgB